MFKFGILLLWTFISICILSLNLQNVQIEAVNVSPRHVHLSLKYEDQMTVTWSTIDLPDVSFVEYGDLNSSLNKAEEGTSEQLTSTDGTLTGIQFIHEATLRDLIPGQIYYYRCVSRNENGNETLTSEIFKFRLPPNGTDWPDGGPNLIIFGDLGFKDAISLPFLESEVETGYWNAMIHIGDLAYDLNENGGEVGNEFMELIQKMAARVPYHVCPGNHEIDYAKDYNDYRKRFKMSGEFDSLMYSWNLGLIHFIAFNTEHYFYTQDQIQIQYDWLQKDLEEANKLRDIRPWIIVYAHTPMYCSKPSAYAHICINSTNPVRVGTHNSPGLEELFYNNGVDLLLWGHEHDYEVSFPLYDYTVFNGSVEDPYLNPRAPVHVITGAAGSKFPSEGFDETIPIPEWSRLRTIEFGYSRLQIENKTHLRFEQMGVTGDGVVKFGKVIDSFTLIQEHHGPFRVAAEYVPKQQNFPEIPGKFPEISISS